MNFNYLNIYDNDLEKCIKKVINDVRKELFNLTEKQTCYIYTSYIYRALKEKCINARIINTQDFGYHYKHFFILVPNDTQYYLIDLTFSQFNDSTMVDLLKNGYQKINDDLLNRYLQIVTKQNITNTSMEELYLKKIIKGGR